MNSPIVSYDDTKTDIRIEIFDKLSFLAYRAAVGGALQVDGGDGEVGDCCYPHAVAARPKANEAAVSSPGG